VKSWIIKLAVSVTVTSFSALLAASAATSSYREGLANLKAGRYQHAEIYLRQALSDRASDPNVHYYLANALVYLAKHHEAIAEYQTSYKLDPYGPVSGYCRRALEAYKAEVPEAGTTSGVAIAVKPPTKYVQDYEPRLESGLNGAIEKIRHDAETEKSRHRQAADSLSTAAVKSGEQQATQIQDAARDEIDRIYNPPANMIGRAAYNPLSFTPEMQKAKADEVRRNADEAAQLARNRAAQKASVYKQWTKEHDFVLDESALNLEKQLHERNLPGTPRLAGVGTGLYVRNYMPSEQPSPYPDPHPGVVRIRPAGATAESDSDESGEQAREAVLEKGDRPGNSVRGTIITH
jgi:tetratricopeptide (TPR) repeat protein